MRIKDNLNKKPLDAAGITELNDKDLLSTSGGMSTLFAGILAVGVIAVSAYLSLKPKIGAGVGAQLAERQSVASRTNVSNTLSETDMISNYNSVNTIPGSPGYDPIDHFTHLVEMQPKCWGSKTATAPPLDTANVFVKELHEEDDIKPGDGGKLKDHVLITRELLRDPHRKNAYLKGETFMIDPSDEHK